MIVLPQHENEEMNIILVNQKQVATKIRTTVNLKESQGCDIIAREILKELPFSACKGIQTKCCAKAQFRYSPSPKIFEKMGLKSLFTR